MRKIFGFMRGSRRPCSLTAEDTVDEKTADMTMGTHIQNKAGLPWPALFFVIGLIIPLFLHIGPLRMSVYRVVLLICLFPAIIALFSGKVGRIRVPDIAIILICLWSTLSYFYNHGVAPMIERVGIFSIETWGSYLIGRVYIRTPDALLKLSRLLFFIALAMVPFALVELQTGRNLWIEIFDRFGGSYTNQIKERRMGFDRVQGPFSHPIHFGVFIGALIGLTFYVVGYHATTTMRYLRALAVAVIGAFALSSGPITAITVQLFIIAWDIVLRSVKARWKILIVVSVVMYVAVDLYSNRSPFEVLIAYTAMNAATAYGRILVWIWGTKSIWENPLFGIGLSGEWERPWWMNSSSVDMFWIVPGMAHGVFTWVMWFVLFFGVFIPVARQKLQSARLQSYRLGYLCSAFGLFAVGWTVHFWDAVYAFLLLMIGAGVWFLDWRETGPTEGTGMQAAVDTSRQKRYTRFTRKAPPTAAPPNAQEPEVAGPAPPARQERRSSGISRPPRPPSRDRGETRTTRG